MDTAIDAKQSKQQAKALKKHPAGLYLLFFTEMWERFSYYGMRAILVLYLTATYISGGLGFKDSTAMSIYGFFTGAVYFTPLIGGYLSDRFLGRRLAITLGGITMAIGNIALFAQQSRTAFYIGLVLLIVGNGFFKPNISTLVGELYEANDRRRDGAFTIFYMGINVGAFFAPLVVGYLSDNLFMTKVNGVVQHGFRYGFLAASIGMIFGQIVFNLLGNRFLGDIGKKPTGKPVAGNGAVVEKKPLTKKEKQRTTVIFILAAFVVIFWAGFEQAGSSLTLYTDRFVDREVFGWVVPTPWFQSLNPLFIVILAPILSALWLKLSYTKRGDFKIPSKMGFGMILLGLGYMVLLLAVLKTGSDDQNIHMKVNILFIVMTYLLNTLGELLLSPVGLSLVSKIAPVKLASLLMGVWLASSGIANILSGQLAALTQSLGYFEIFGAIGLMAIVLGFVLLSISTKLVKMMD